MKKLIFSSLLLFLASGLLHGRAMDASTRVFDPDTFKHIHIDGYPISDALLFQSQHDYYSGVLKTCDQVWFGNMALQQTLMFELYFGEHRLHTFHFMNSEVPPGILEDMNLYDIAGDVASFEQKKEFLCGLTEQACMIDKHYFTTNKGIKLGDSKMKALNVYGKPNQMAISGKYDCLIWNFTGDQTPQEEAMPDGKPLVKNSYGFELKMYFKNGVLVAQSIYNKVD